MISLHPSFFGPRVKEYLTTKLFDDVEGTCTGQYYIVCVVDAFDISEGRVVPGSGLAEYTIRYRAVVWKPFKGEIVRNCGTYSSQYRLTLRAQQLDALVTSVNRQGFFADVGPLPVFVSNHVRPL